MYFYTRIVFVERPGAFIHASHYLSGIHSDCSYFSRIEKILVDKMLPKE